MPPRTCCFILDTGPWTSKPPKWCGDPVRDDPPSIYCPYHHRLCYLPVAKRKGTPIFFQAAVPVR